MNRSLRESMMGGGGGRNLPVLSSQHHHRRGLSNGNNVKETASDENLDLFSRNRRTLSTASSDESSEVSLKLGRLSIGSTKQVKNGLDDLLSSTDGGKHDYDWLLTPPGTPLVPSSDRNESQPTSLAPRGSSLARSVSTTKSSRLSVSQSESNHPARPTRSNSVTRPSISSNQYTTYSNKSSNILNTSSASVSSYIRPSTPGRSSSITRPSTPSRPSVSRPSTPSKVRPTPSTPSIERTRPTQSSRPSTPSSRPQIPANLNSPAPRSISRPSTPTRRNSAPSLSPASSISSISSGRALPNGRSPASVSRPSSPSPRVRPTPQPIVLPDFPLETPPNLRTTLPDRPLSAGRSRPGAALTVKGNTEAPSSAPLSRRPSSPVVTRGRLTDPAGKGRVLSNGHASNTSESRRAQNVSELSTRKPVKAAPENTGFGRNISKKSLDMAIRHMDIRNGSANGVRALTGSALFPQSVRTNNLRSQPGHASAPSSVNGDMSFSSNGAARENGSYLNRSSENGNGEDKPRYSAKLTDVDIYESSRYDMILLKEDARNTSWLHSLDDKPDQGLIFDNGFEPLPEPFDPL